MFTQLRFLYFDLGWTLIDELPAMRVRARQTCEQLARFGINATPENLLERCLAHGRINANSPYRAALRDILGTRADELLLAVQVPYDDSFERLFESVPEMLAQLASRYRLGVIANQSGDIRPARGRGWRTVQVRQGFAKSQEPAETHEKPDFEITTITDISALLLTSRDERQSVFA